MNILLTVVVFVIIFSVLILVHELGHFVMAKRAGIKVEEFGFGLPPRIWGKKKGETIYSINLIPFGGFVRMQGEDSTDPKLLKSKRSFAAQPMRARVMVIIAGVAMNFLLAWFLLAIGFTVGMQPLISSSDEALEAVNQGQIITVPGLKIGDVEKGSTVEKVGFKAGDVIYSINGVDVDTSKILEDPVGKYAINRDGEKLTLEISPAMRGQKGEKVGFVFRDFSLFPRVRFYDIEPYTDFYKAGLRTGDIILTVNNSQIFDINQFEDDIRGVPGLDFKVYRDGKIEEVMVERKESKRVILSEILSDSNAEKAGFKVGDVILNVNGKEFFDIQNLIDFIKENKGKKLLFSLNRNGGVLNIEVSPAEDGKIGVVLSELMNYAANQGVSVFNVNLLTSVLEVKNEKYPFYIAAWKSFGESYRLAKLTGEMFIGVIGNLIGSGQVPDSVAGPVGIAQMTHVFVQEGVIPLLRFVALLSLSLAAINILPIPALDGGRLLFIVIELIIGRRVNQKWESWIHALGYALLILLILMVTYSDIMRLITS